MSVFSSCPPIGCEYVRIQEAYKNISVFTTVSSNCVMMYRRDVVYHVQMG